MLFMTLMTIEPREAGPQDPRIGTVIDGRYRVDRLLGTGGSGAIYAAWHLHLSRAVALKLLHPELASSPEHVERFKLEAQVMGLVAHEHVVEVLDFRYCDGQPYLVMELLEGETLRARLRRQGALTVPQMHDLFHAFCGAMAQAHERGVVHCDLKPENLMFQRCEDGEVLKILDFGSARLLRGPAVPGPAPGTPHYLAPERLREGAAVDQRADLFAMGAILYECLSGARAFGGDQPILQVLEEPVPPLLLSDAQVAAALDKVIARACHKDPARRFSSARDLYRQIQGALEPSVAPEDSGLFVRPSLAPRPPALLSGAAPLGVGVKAFLLRHVAGQLARQAGEALGPDFSRQAEALVMTDWVDIAELHRLCGAAGLDAEEACRIGRSFVDAARRGVYRVLFDKADPGYMLRRAQVLLGRWFTEGEATARELSPGRFELLVRLRGMTLVLAAGIGGFWERALELAGAVDVQVEPGPVEGEGCRFAISFV
jgi:hypothetical protein